jgi:hypothetical protein
MQARGMSLVDVVVGTALVLIIFLGLFTMLNTSLGISTLVKAESTATAIANNQMETIRSLPYASVGTVGGIPSGATPQDATTTEDGISYGVHTFIDYYDDPSDGLGASDSNGITTDYKRIKVVVSYVYKRQSKQIVLVSDYIPAGLETSSGGGTLQIKVVNSQGVAVTGATVVVTNASTSPTVNLTTFSDTTGTVSLPGAATSTQYAVTVSKSGYSTAQTYARDSNNQNPTPGYITVVQNQTTTSTFAVDTLGTLTMQTFTAATSSSFADTFTTNAQIASSTLVTNSGSGLVLTGSSGSYPTYTTVGLAQSVPITSAQLSSWSTFSATATKPSNTQVIIQVVDGSGNVIPDNVLSGNQSGFAPGSPVNISTLSTTTYPSLAIRATLYTTSNLVTPTLTAWSLTYQSSGTPIPNVPLIITGSKTIGTTGAGAPIYKTSLHSSTGSSGGISIPLEWDSYSITATGYDVLDACSAPPYALAAGGSLLGSLTLGSSTSNSLLVNVTDGSGNIVPGATVTVSRSGYNNSVTSSACGNAYFGGITSATDYTVVISKTGYTTTTVTNVKVTGQIFYGAAF